MFRYDNPIKFGILWPIFFACTLFATFVIADPVITRIRPAIGHIKGGMVVAIEGNGFSDVTALNFGDQPATFVVHSDLLITATVPAHTPRVVPITLVTSEGVSEITQETFFTYRGNPLVFEANADQKKVIAFDSTTNETLATLALPGKPRSMALAADGTKLFVILEEENGKVVIDTAQMSLLPDATFDIETFPFNEMSLCAKMPDPPPLAKFHCEKTSLDSSTIDFNASESISPVGAIEEFFWDFGDGETIKTSKPLFSHHYAKAGIYPVTLSVTNSAGLSSVKSIEVITAEVSTNTEIADITVPNSVTGYVGESFKYTLTMPAALKYDATGLPPGLSIDSVTGEIAGNPTLAGVFSAILFAKYADGAGAKPLTIHIIKCEARLVTPSNLPEGLENHRYTTTITASGVPPFDFEIYSGNLPFGLILNHATGEISGISKGSGTFNFTISVTDQQNCLAIQDYTITIQPLLVCPAPKFVAKQLVVGVLGEFYTETIPVSGGKAPITFAVKPRKLPPGLKLDSTSGTISGIPTEVGTYSFELTAKSRCGKAATRRCVITIKRS